jgi:DNA-binding LytR/AlgR family response regulator
MIKIFIIEDEIPARKKLRRYIESMEESIVIIAEIDTVSKAIEFLNHNSPDMIFSDIELLDGNAFEIYRTVSLACPIIFTTAYDQFWMDAFDTNGIDYLLKPFTLDRFQKAWDKWRLLSSSSSENQTLITKITKIIDQNTALKSYKKRFTIQSQQSIYFLETQNVTYFEAKEGLVFAHDINGKRHVLTESTLKELEIHLDPSEFFKINRGEIVHKVYIEKIERYTKSTLSVKLRDVQRFFVTIQSCTGEFRRWISD